MKSKGRTFTLAIVITLILATTQALPSETLEKEKPHLSLDEENLNIETETILDKDIKYEELLFPDKYHEELNTLEIEKTAIEDTIEIKYSFNSDEDLPQPLSEEPTHTETLLQVHENSPTQFSKYGPDKIAEIEHGHIKTNLYLHYNTVKAEYIIQNGEETITETDLYKGEETDKLPVIIDRNEEEIELAYDNSISESTTKQLHILRYEESEISDITVENGQIQQQCHSDFNEDTLPQLDESGISTEMMPGHILNHELECSELLIEEDSVTTATIKFNNEDPIQEVDGDLEVLHENNHYIYVIGSGSASRAFEGYEFCGDYNYNNILIDGNVQVCEDGATLNAEDTIKINGEIDGQGQVREDGANLTLNANYIEQNKAIDLRGGDGGAIIPNAADGGQLTVDATTYYADKITTNGGDGTQQQGGNAGQAGDISITANNFEQSSPINATGGHGGTGTESGDGGNGGDAANITIHAGQAIIEDTKITAKGGKGGNGGDAGEEECKGGHGEIGGNGGGINIESEILDLYNTELDTSSGPGGDAGTPLEGCQKGNGGDAGTPNNIYKGLYLHGGNATYNSNNFYSIGGDGGNGKIGGDGADGGDIVRKWENELDQENNNEFLTGGDGGDSKQNETWTSELNDVQTTDLNFDTQVQQDYSYIQQVGFEPDNGGIFEVKIEYYDGESFAETTVEGEADKWVTAEFGINDYRRLLQEDDDIFVSVNLQGEESASYRVTSKTEIGNIVTPDTANFPAHYESEGGTALNSTFTGKTGEDGILTETQETNDFQETTIDLEQQSFTIQDRDTGVEYYIQESNNASIEFNFTTDEDIIDNVEADIIDPQDELAENIDMNIQDSYETQDGEYFWSYTAQFNIPEEIESAGAWLVTTKVHDDLGDTHTRSSDAIYMYTTKQVIETRQETASLTEPIDIQQTVETSNPSLFDYQNVGLEHTLIDTANLQQVDVERLGEEKDTNIDSTQNLVKWSTDSLPSEGINEWTINYDINQIEKDTQIEEEDQAGQVKTVTKTITLENPSDEHTITDIVATPDIPQPQEVVDWSLQLEGEDVTQDPDINPELVDTTLDGTQDSLRFNIEQLETDETQEWEITSFLGDPITKYSEDVITNHPVQEGKTIEWRIGYAFENNNDFPLQHQDRLRIPLEASNARIDGQLRPTRFDEEGAYIQFEEEIPANTNQTRFLTFESRSISTTSTLQEQEQLFIDDDTTAEIDLNIENLVNRQLTDIEHPIQIQYGENVHVVDNEQEEVIQEEGTVNQEFTLELASIEPGEIKDLSVKYDTQTGESELVREGRTDEGNNLNVYRIDSNSNQPLDNIWMQIDEIDCVEVEEIRKLGENQTSATSVIDDYKCGSTKIPLGTLLPDDEIYIGVEYRGTEPTISMENPHIQVLIGAGKFIFYGLIIVGAEAGRRRWLT